LVRQARDGGSWHMNVSLAQTGHWLRSLGNSMVVLTPKLPRSHLFSKRVLPDSVN
jgi:hypothetical protein